MELVASTVFDLSLNMEPQALLDPNPDVFPMLYMNPKKLNCFIGFPIGIPEAEWTMRNLSAEVSSDSVVLDIANSIVIVRWNL